MAKYTWRTGNGDLAAAANWTNTTTGANPALAAPGSGDDATLAAPGGTVTGTAALNSLTIAGGAPAPWLFTGQVTTGNAYLVGAAALQAGGKLLFNAGPKSAYLLAIGQSSGSQPATGGSLLVTGAGSLVDGGTQGSASVGQLGGSGTLTISGGGTGRFASTSTPDAAALAVGRQGTGAATVTGSGSSLALSGVMYAGRASGSSGTITVSAGAALTQASIAATDVNGIGDNGTIGGVFATGGKGELDVLGGGTATLANQVIVGGSGATGVVTVSDSGSQLLLGDALAIGTGTGAPNGTGTLTVQNGGAVRLTAAADTSRSFLVAGEQASTAGTIAVAGSGSLLDAGANAASIGNTGTGTLTVSSGGTMRSGSGDSRVRSALFAGNLAGSSGTVTLTGPGSAVDAKGYVYIGRAGTGALVVDQKGSFTGGQAASGDGTGANAAFAVSIGDGTPALDVNGQPNAQPNFGGAGSAKVLGGGTLASRSGLRVGYRGTAGTLLVDGGGVAQAAGRIYAGSGTDRAGGSGAITVQGGGTLRSLGPHMAGSGSIQVAADLAGNSGSITVSGAGSLLDAGGDRISVGISGTGSLLVQGGATATGGNTLYAAPATEAGFSLGSQGGTGTATVTGAGSVLAINGSMTIGGSAAAAAGSGTLTAAAGGVARGTSAILYAKGVLHAGADGLIQVGGGSAAGLTGVAVLSGGSLVAHGGRIEGDVSDAGTLANDGALTVTGSIGGAGTLTLGTGTLDVGGSIGGPALAFVSPAAVLRVRGLQGVTNRHGLPGRGPDRPGSGGRGRGHADEHGGRHGAGGRRRHDQPGNGAGWQLQPGQRRQWRDRAADPGGGRAGAGGDRHRPAGRELRSRRHGGGDGGTDGFGRCRQRPCHLHLRQRAVRGGDSRPGQRGGRDRAAGRNRAGAARRLWRAGGPGRRRRDPVRCGRGRGGADRQRRR